MKHVRTNAKCLTSVLLVAIASTSVDSPTLILKKKKDVPSGCHVRWESDRNIVNTGAKAHDKLETVCSTAPLLLVH